LKFNATTADRTSDQFLRDIAMRILLMSSGVNELGALMLEAGVLVKQTIASAITAAPMPHRMSIRFPLDMTCSAWQVRRRTCLSSHPGGWSNPLHENFPFTNGYESGVASF
jgi:hypothetical protein